MASPSLASRSKQTGRPPSDTDDVVMARAIEFAAWARKHARIVIGTAIVSAVVVGGLIWYYRFERPRVAAKASVEFMQVERTAAGNPALAERDLRAFIQRFGGTPEADQARLLLARQHLEANAPKNAIPVLQAVEADYERPLGAQAGLLLGAAQAQAGNRDAAIATYLRVADEAENAFHREEALSEAALLRQQAGNHAGAAELWRRLVEGAEEGSIQRSIYEMRLAEAEGRARAG